MKILYCLLLAVAAPRRVVSNNENICISETNVYTAKVNLFAGELGYYTFDECPDQVNPTVGIQLGQVYTFKQNDRSNYFHPLGFAYYPDGAHAEVDELEPGIAPPKSNSSCAETLSCPAPMYFRNGTYLGTYSNIPEVANVTQAEDNFGLDDYEPLFFRPIPEWAGFGDFEIQLKFDVNDFNSDIFYFCHIHEFMTGRIKLLNGNSPVQELSDLPEIPYPYDEISAFDEKCGTFGLDTYQLPHPECPERFVCNVPANNPGLAQFSECIEAMDCAMLAGMTTNIESQSMTALFIHQMIPHHENAVNMAKALLKTGLVECDDLTEETDGCVLESILREIVNNQNFQIQAMKGILDTMGYPETDDCEVLIEESFANETSTSTSTPPGGTETSNSRGNPVRMTLAGTAFSCLCLVH